MNCRRALKLALYAVATLFFIAITAPTASAFTYNVNVILYDSPGLCVQGSAWIDHLKPGVFSGNQASDNMYALSQGCVDPGLSLPNDWAAVRLDVYKWTGSNWALCRGTNWQYGPTGVTAGQFGGLD
jgi:hypothetical protein